MESQTLKSAFGPAVHVDQMADAPSVIVVCEHASNRVPAHLKGLGLDADTLTQHIAWDPGALPVAKGIARRLNAVLVYGGISRLVYDCNRPPNAPDAIPSRSEVFEIPGNTDLSDANRAARVDQVHRPFSTTLTEQIGVHRAHLRMMVTVHSFTPVYRGQTRDVQIGVLHGDDDRLAHAMMQTIPADLGMEVQLNEPYAASDGVAHTLNKHAVPYGLPNVMIEIRNDLIETEAQQAAIAGALAAWVAQAEAHLTERSTA
ncbi:N-formylglutamate amidohydrolase [Aliiroseovarius halocynthiae]|uniref:N-formylglutamate amidohydrolase n=1 Tax=Aliiroseovarius halocynthiae TaxID=985055 RepID=A0A545SQ56_9RHOB|nr:N-formylglutamate amidohydrolase [Aliiroseovarius halocynthiae]TQV67110.1 N-formylglutamate amidohydrolase [Aliiroseovarius halocynthiae]